MQASMSDALLHLIGSNYWALRYSPFVLILSLSKDRSMNGKAPPRLFARSPFDKLRANGEVRARMTLT
jgi:hypothetical protein